MDPKKVDLTDPAIIVGFVFVIFGDFAFLFIIGAAIPIVGLAIALYVLGIHYFMGVIMLAMFWSRTHGWLAKLVLFLAVLLPLPLLTLGTILAIILSNKFVAMVTEQLIIQGIAALTAGAGEALEVGAVAEVSAEATVAAVEVGEAATEVEEAVEVGRAATEGVGAARGGVEAAEVGGAAEGGEAAEAPEKGRELELKLGARKTPEEEQMEMFKEVPKAEPQEAVPEEEKPSKEVGEKKEEKIEQLKKALERARKVGEKLEGPPKEEEEKEGGEEDRAIAA